jgi:hypothetical protein
MPARLRTLHPFETPDAQRLAVLFAVVSFAQGMWYLPNQTLTIVLKERGLSAGQMATFFTISTISSAFTALAWLLVPLVHMDRIEARAREARGTTAPPGAA